MKLHNLMAAVLGFAALAPSASALEFSMVSGLYQSEKDKVNGESAGGRSTIDLGTRVAGPIDQHLHWFGEGRLTLRSYDAPSGAKAPDDTTSISAGGGVRYYFSRFSSFSVPFVSGYALYRNDKDADTATSTTEKSGLYYGSSAGVRFGLDNDFFLDLETNLFESALFATETTESTTTTATGTTTSKQTKTRTELYVNTTGAFSGVTVALGLKI